MWKLPYTLSYSQYLGSTKEAKKQLINLTTQRRPRFGTNVVPPVFRGPWRPELKLEKKNMQNLVWPLHSFIHSNDVGINQSDWIPVPIPWYVCFSLGCSSFLVDCGCSLVIKLLPHVYTFLSSIPSITQSRYFLPIVCQISARHCMMFGIASFPLRFNFLICDKQSGKQELLQVQ